MRETGDNRLISYDWGMSTPSWNRISERLWIVDSIAVFKIFQHQMRLGYGKKLKREKLSRLLSDIWSISTSIEVRNMRETWNNRHKSDI